MKRIIGIWLFCTGFQSVVAQTYDSLQRLTTMEQSVYFSKGIQSRAASIAENVKKAEAYFKKEFNLKPDYTLLILNPQDWQTYAHPKAIYGIPHFLPDGRLVVASENNEFWRRNIPPLEKLPKALADQVKKVYTNNAGELSLMAFFDLLAIHELGHAFQKAAGLRAQRNWLGETLCNILLHTYVAENDPKRLPALTVFPAMTVAGIDTSTLKYTRLEDFQTHYNEIAQHHPDNYGWFQCRFHVMAGEVYDKGGVRALKSIWNVLSAQKENLKDPELTALLEKTDPALKQAISSWNQ